MPFYATLTDSISTTVANVANGYDGVIDDSLYSIDFDSSRVTPTSQENRPVNTAVRYLIRALR